MPEIKSSTVFINASTKLLSVIVLIGLSLAVFAYRRSLEPLYGSAPVELHFSKVLWLSCILGSFAPTLPIWPVTLLGGVLLLAMPQTAYWAAVFTGKLGDPVVGPVLTHLLVITPVVALGVGIVKALQQLNVPDGPQATETSQQQLITLPICQTAISAISELWASLQYTSSLPEHQIFVQLGIIAVSAWIISPYLPTFVVAKAQVNVIPQPAPLSPPKTGSQRRKAKREGATAQPQSPPKTPSPKTPSPKTKSPTVVSQLFRLALVPLLPFLPWIITPPTLSKPLLEPYTLSGYPLRILSSAPSRFSSVVVVGETNVTSSTDAVPGHSLRYLRAGHSLLGGVYVGDSVHALRGRKTASFDEAGNPLGDSIYSTFVLQEAAQLVKNSGKNSDEKKALFIGLGAGISASAFMRNNINSTIIEIDPEVYEASKRFFGLPTHNLNQVALLDANLWVKGRIDRLENRTAEAAEATEATESLADDNVEDLEPFDIVIHDCFSGGGLPAHLYTQEHFRNLKSIMQTDGVIAVNTVGPLTSDSTRAIALTLTSVFGECRVFYDATTNTSAGALETEHINWIFFCSPSPEPIEFRAPRDAEFLDSPLRKHMLSNFLQHEVDINRITKSIPEDKISKYILTYANNPLSLWQKKDALNHWKIMRDILPDIVWETY